VEIRDLWDLKVRQDRTDLLVQEAKLDHVVPMEPSENPETQVLPETKDSQE